MINVKKEILPLLKDKDIKCAKVGCHKLKIGHTKEDLEKFLDKLDYIYDNHRYYTLCGTVWFKDGTWIDRNHCDCGSEWVEHSLPKIPKELALIKN